MRCFEMFFTRESKDEELDLPLFDFATISDATNNFSLKNKLGEGGFGPVYRVNMLPSALSVLQTNCLKSA